MIDFKNPQYIKLHPCEKAGFLDFVADILASGEEICYTFKSIRDGIVFTNKRLIVISTEGVTGKKKDITSLPYSKIQSFSVETSGVFDIDSELQLWFSGLGPVKLEFSSSASIKEVCRTISEYVL